MHPPIERFKYIDQMSNGSKTVPPSTCWLLRAFVYKMIIVPYNIIFSSPRRDECKADSSWDVLVHSTNSNTSATAIFAEFPMKMDQK